MFGRKSSRSPGPSGSAGTPVGVGRRTRRHGRRPIRSSLAGPYLPNPDARVTRFEIDARAAVELLQLRFPHELHGVSIGFETAPTGRGESSQPQYYSVDRAARTIMLFRVPIQRARVLHVDDEEHRRLFVHHCVYLAVCEYLGREPWELWPGRFDHF